MEIAILNGVLELNSKNVEEIMTPLKVLCHYVYVSLGKLNVHWLFAGYGGVKR